MPHPWLILVFLFASFARADKGPPDTFILHVCGISGTRTLDRGFVGGLVQGGINAEVEQFDWTGDQAGLMALGQIQRNRGEAKLLADLIVERHKAHAHQRFILTCHSGGAGITAWALEQLPDGVTIDTWLLIQPALSPQYDLSKALARVTRAYAFVSEHDAFVLGTGTRTFGTIDRVFTNAAGLSGFVVPAGADRNQYAKLAQIPYRDAWVRQGNLGDHIGPMLRSFSRDTISPLLQTGTIPGDPAPPPPLSPAAPSTQPTTAPAR